MEQYSNCNRNSCGGYPVRQSSNTRYMNNHSVTKGMNDIYGYKYNQPVGMAYVPSQEFDEMYDAKKGLCEGTMFPELNLIFCGIRGMK